MITSIKILSSIIYLTSELFFYANEKIEHKLE